LVNSAVKMLGLLVLLTIMLQPSAALDKYFIYVRNENGDYIQEASLKIWNGDTLVDKGYTDADGKFTAWLDKDTRYRIVAENNGRYKEWNEFPPRNSVRIEIRVAYVVY